MHGNALGNAVLFTGQNNPQINVDTCQLSRRPSSRVACPQAMPVDNYWRFGLPRRHR